MFVRSSLSQYRNEKKLFVILKQWFINEKKIGASRSKEAHYILNTIIIFVRPRRRQNKIGYLFQKKRRKQNITNKEKPDKNVVWNKARLS